MGRVLTKAAQVISSNVVHFGFPYEGETHAVLKLRKGSKGQDVIFKVERGQFVSPASSGYVTVRFDDSELQEFEVGESVESTTGVLFINDEERFISQLRNANKVKIEANFYQEGRRVFDFDVAAWTGKEFEPRVKYCEIIADNLSKARLELGCLSAIDSNGRTFWIADAHRDDGKRFVVHADEILTAFLELESAIRAVSS